MIGGHLLSFQHRLSGEGVGVCIRIVTLLAGGGQFVGEGETNRSVGLCDSLWNVIEALVFSHAHTLKHTFIHTLKHDVPNMFINSKKQLYYFTNMFKHAHTIYSKINQLQ